MVSIGNVLRQQYKEYKLQIITKSIPDPELKDKNYKPIDLEETLKANSPKKHKELIQAVHLAKTKGEGGKKTDEKHHDIMEALEALVKEIKAC